MATRPPRGSFALAAMLVVAGAWSCKSKEPGDSTPTEHLDSDGDGLNDWDEVHVHHTDPNNADTDGDGLSDADELNVYGTDPTITDTDGDGSDDKLEVDSHTDPTQAFSHPYIGDYKVGTCKEYPDKADAHPNGFHIMQTDESGAVTVPLYQVGDTIQNEQLIDQFGEPVDLYSFCGVNFDLLFIQLNQLGTSEYDGLTCWIDDFNNVRQHYRDYGYQLIIVLTQNNATALPTTTDLDAVSRLLFGTEYDQVPVLGSQDESVNGFHNWFEKDWHEPTLVHIGPELNVLSVDKDDCSGVDRDPCPYMGTAVPKGECWENPDPHCEKRDIYCACPAPACEAYCGEDKCPITY
jgi:hypothetical protein